MMASVDPASVLQILQSRLASSPAAIYRSLERRRRRLKERLTEERLQGHSSLAATRTYDFDDPEDITEAELTILRELEAMVSHARRDVR
ncbi:MAG: hypothetical protein ACTHLT_19040 [Devosia sp.]